MNLVRLFTLSTLFSLCLSLSAQAESYNEKVDREHAEQLTRLEQLTPLQQEMISVNCDDTKEYKGSHRVCLRNTINALLADGRPDISSISKDLQIETERACAKKLLFSAELYHKCLTKSIKELAKESYRPNIESLSSAERQTVEEKCELSKKFGPGSYNRCLRHNTNKVRGVSYGTMELKDLSDTQKAQIREVCEISMFETDKKAYSFCLKQEAAALLGKPAPTLQQRQPSYKRPSAPTAPKPTDPTRTMNNSLKVIANTKDTGSTLVVAPVKKVATPSMQAKRTTLDPASLYETAAPSVYVVLAAKSVADFKAKKGVMQGSAVAFSGRDLVTNCHVVDGNPVLLVVQDRSVFPAIQTSSNASADRCTIQVTEGTVQPIGGTRKFADLKVGERIYAIGTPSGLERTLSEGLISGLRTAEPHGKLIQISAAISPGSSGGGLFDANGNLIGVTTFGLKNTGQLNFALAVEQYWQ